MRARVAALAVVLAGAVPATAAAAPTVVTFGFDDGTANQLQAAALLQERGMAGTFFVNSGNIGKTGEYMTWDDLAALKAAGHEIGGHTTSHKNLVTLYGTDGAAAVQAEVCDDRDALIDKGFTDIVSFAYPNGAHNAEVRAIVQGCGYSNARTTEGIDPPPCGDDCAEWIPPAMLYRTRAAQLLTETTAEDVIGSFVAAHESGGGWLQLVLHDVCNGCGGGYEISLEELTTIVNWLEEHACEGYVVARTRDVIENNIPAVPACPAPPADPPASGGGGAGGGGGGGGGGGAPATAAPSSQPVSAPSTDAPPAIAEPVAPQGMPAPLTVTLTKPKMSRGGWITVNASVTAPGPVRWVRFLVNGRSVTVDRTAPYRLRWKPKPGRTARRLTITAEVVTVDGTKASSTTRTLRVRARR